MKPDPPLTQEKLETLLAWLDPDPLRAAARYELIRRGLIDRFINRGCVDAESLADETIDRVTRRVEEISKTYEGNPASYFHGVAKNVFREYCRQKRIEARQPPPTPEPVFSEVYYDCLERCLGELAADKRGLILRYYLEMKRDKIESRKKIRAEMSLKPDALRVRAYRIRKTLERCVRDCILSNETV